MRFNKKTGRREGESEQPTDSTRRTLETKSQATLAAFRRLEHKVFSPIYHFEETKKLNTEAER